MKIIKIDPDKCTGCRACEAICSAYHNHAVVNPKRARIKVFEDEHNDVYVPIMAGPYTDAECNGRNVIIMKGKAYGECSFCRAACPSRDYFREPDARDIPLKCDCCGDSEPEGGPLCVQMCLSEALVCEEREEPDRVVKNDKEHSIEYLIEKYGVADIKKFIADMDE